MELLIVQLSAISSLYILSYILMRSQHETQNVKTHSMTNK